MLLYIEFYINKQPQDTISLQVDLYTKMKQRMRLIYLLRVCRIFFLRPKNVCGHGGQMFAQSTARFRPCVHPPKNVVGCWMFDDLCLSDIGFWDRKQTG